MLLWFILPVSKATKRRNYLMNENKSARRKTLTWATIAYAAFTALSVIGPIILDRAWKRRDTNKR